MSSTSPRRRPRLLRALVVLVATTALGALPAGPADATDPPNPTGLPAEIELLQPYVGQSTCDPVAKPGVRAFSNLILSTYPGTSSLGIVRDCGAGDQSEHKEGRAWDWGVSVNNPAQVQQVNDLLSWLLRPNEAGQEHAAARRLGIMYIIWNRQIWKAYQADKGWQAYSGPNPHTDHVHFSFGWNGAKQATSYWTKKVAPVDYGPNGTPPATPKRDPANLAVLKNYGALTLKQGSSGAAVTAVQRALFVTADGSYGPQTASAVQLFQDSQGLERTGTFGPVEWKALFPPPIDPFGSFDVLSDGAAGTLMAGWAVDVDSTDPTEVHVYVDGKGFSVQRANASRPDVGSAYPGVGDNRGFSFALDLPDGTHEVCLYGYNVGPGQSRELACKSITVWHDPRGASDVLVVKPGEVRAAGWTLDPDEKAPLQVVVSSGTQALGRATADRARPDVAQQYPASGEDVGYDVVQDLNALPEGTSKVCLTSANVMRGKDLPLACTTAAVRHTPFGNLDVVQRVPGGVRVAGWAVEPDGDAPAQVRVSVGGAVTTLTADRPRADIGAGFPLYGARHGFDTVVPAADGEGTQPVCATALNAEVGADAGIGCSSVPVSHRPVGAFDTVAASPDGRITVAGWALDPDTADGIEVHTYVDGRGAAITTAVRSRPDVASAFPGFGDAHGYETVVTGTYGKGSHSVCVYAINAAQGTDNRSLGCRTVTVS